MRPESPCAGSRRVFRIIACCRDTQQPEEKNRVNPALVFRKQNIRVPTAGLHVTAALPVRHKGGVPVVVTKYLSLCFHCIRIRL